MEAEVKHYCHYRDDSRGIWNTFRDWWILPLHFLLTLALCCGLLLGVDGHVFDIGEHTSLRGRLSQSDLVTVISIALVFVRLLAGAWLALAGWRMGFIMMEKGGATLTQLDHLITYRLPMLRRASPRSHSRHPPQYPRSVFAILWLISILATPSQFIAPIATGAITWHPYIDINLTEAKRDVKVTTPGTTNTLKDQYNSFENFQQSRYLVVQQSNGLTSIAAQPSSSITNSSFPIFRRRISSAINQPIHTRMENVSIPAFVIDSLEWIQAQSDLSEDEISTLYYAQTDFEFPQTNFSTNMNPINSWTGYDVGVLSTIPPKPWQPEKVIETGPGELDWYYEWPEPERISDSYLVMVLTHRNDSDYFTPWNQCGEIASPRFGDTNGTTPWLYFNTATDLPHCYAIARVNFTAGVVDCNNCVMEAPGIVEYRPADRAPETQPHALTSTALAMMPEVLVGSAIANATLAPTWENLDGYTRWMLSTAYQSSWNALSEAFVSPEAEMQTTTFTPPLQALQARVVQWRVYLWGVLNALVAVSGALLAMLQRGCRHKTIRHPAIAALLLDAGPMVRADATGICNATSLNSSDDNIGVRLRLQSPGQGYRHPVLVPDGPMGKLPLSPPPIEPEDVRSGRYQSMAVLNEHMPLNALNTSNNGVLFRKSHDRPPLSIITQPVHTIPAYNPISPHETDLREPMSAISPYTPIHPANSPVHSPVTNPRRSASIYSPISTAHARQKSDSMRSSVSGAEDYRISHVAVPSTHRPGSQDEVFRMQRQGSRAQLVRTQRAGSTLERLRTERHDSSRASPFVYPSGRWKASEALAPMTPR